MSSTTTPTAQQAIPDPDGHVPITVTPLGQPWPGTDPFLFVAHHVDHYPAGDEHQGPAVDLTDRSLGNDFGNPSGWNMYHGDTVPGFPAHPHRGFETVTVVRRGLVDHADSTGASARYGEGDVQWVTAGEGVSHSEMFPLVNAHADNPFELYQIWLNLPARSKSAPPEFKMLWNSDIPVVETSGPQGGTARVHVIAGRLDGDTAPTPPVNSWAADAETDVAIWLIDLEPHARVELPPSRRDDTRRVLYVHGSTSASSDVGPAASVTIGATHVPTGSAAAPAANAPLVLTTAEQPVTVLLLQGVPIGEPVTSYGPFVMNDEQEIRQAFDDYRRTRFGGWPWPDEAPVHPRETARFARHGDGRVEHPAG